MSFKPLFLAALTLCACELPPVVPTVDARQNQKASRIEGTVVVQSRARGNAVVLLYDAARPPPPAGTGRPISFDVIPSARLFQDGLGDPNRSGPFTAPFNFSLVAPGNYLVQGFIDHDECLTNAPGCVPPDFIPWYSVTAEPNRGDVGGAAVDAVTRLPRVIPVGTTTERLNPVTDVVVSYSDLAAVPVDRPSFAVAGDPLFSPGTTTKVLELSPTAINDGLIHQRQPVFLAKYIDEDGNGVPDDANGDGVGDFWPKVVVRKLKDAPPFLIDENDEDQNGIVDATGPDYPRYDGTLDGRPDIVVLAAGLDPSLILPALTDAMGRPRLDAVPVPKLRLVIQMRAFDASNPAAPTPLANVPQGRYALIVMQLTGQTWRVPNELQPVVANAAGLPAVESQAFMLEVR